MKYLFPFLCSIPLVAQMNPSGEALHTMEGEAAVAQKRGGSEVLVITAIERANDIKHAFEFLQKNQPGSALQLILSDGRIINSILAINVMPGGTLMMVQANTMKGQVYEVVRTETVTEVRVN